MHPFTQHDAHGNNSRVVVRALRLDDETKVDAVFECCVTARARWKSESRETNNALSCKHTRALIDQMKRVRLTRGWWRVNCGILVTQKLTKFPRAASRHICDRGVERDMQYNLIQTYTRTTERVVVAALRHSDGAKVDRVPKSTIQTRVMQDTGRNSRCTK